MPIFFGGYIVVTVGLLSISYMGLSADAGRTGNVCPSPCVQSPPMALPSVQKTRKRREKEANRNLPRHPKRPDTIATVIYGVAWGPFFARIFFWFFRPADRNPSSMLAGTADGTWFCLHALSFTFASCTCAGILVQLFPDMLASSMLFLEKREFQNMNRTPQS